MFIFVWIIPSAKPILSPENCFIQYLSFISQQFGKILDVEIIFNERGSKVSKFPVVSSHFFIWVSIGIQSDFNLFLGFWICDIWKWSGSRSSEREAQRNDRRRKEDWGMRVINFCIGRTDNWTTDQLNDSAFQVNNATARVVTKKPQSPLVNSEIPS